MNSSHDTISKELVPNSIVILVNVERLGVKKLDRLMFCAFISGRKGTWKCLGFTNDISEAKKIKKDEPDNIVLVSWQEIQKTFPDFMNIETIIVASEMLRRATAKTEEPFCIDFINEIT